MFTIVCKAREPISSDTRIEKKKEKKKCYPMRRVEPQLLDHPILLSCSEIVYLAL